MPQNSRYAERVFYSSLLSAQTVATLSGSCQTNQLRSSSLLLGTLSHGAHEPISIALRTRFLDAPAYGSKCSFAKIAIPCTIYPSLNLLAFLSISVVLQICFDKKRLIQLSILKKTSPKLQSAPIHISMNQGALLYPDR